MLPFQLYLQTRHGDETEGADSERRLRRNRRSDTSQQQARRPRRDGGNTGDTAAALCAQRKTQRNHNALHSHTRELTRAHTANDAPKKNERRSRTHHAMSSPRRPQMRMAWISWSVHALGPPCFWRFRCLPFLTHLLPISCTNRCNCPSSPCRTFSALESLEGTQGGEHCATAADLPPKLLCVTE